MSGRVSRLPRRAVQLARGAMAPSRRPLRSVAAERARSAAPTPPPSPGAAPAGASSGRENPPRGRAAPCRGRPDGTCRRECRPRPRSRTPSPPRRRRRRRLPIDQVEESRKALAQIDAAAAGVADARRRGCSSRSSAAASRNAGASQSMAGRAVRGPPGPAAACPAVLSRGQRVRGLGNDLHRASRWSRRR